MPVVFPCSTVLCRFVEIIFSNEKVIYKHICWFIPDAVPLFSTPIRANRAGELHSSCVDVTGISDSGEPREPDAWHSRSQLFDQTNNSLTGNPFSAGGVTSDDSISEEDSVVSVEPIFDDHHFPDLEQRYGNRGYNTVM